MNNSSRLSCDQHPLKKTVFSIMALHHKSSPCGQVQNMKSEWPIPVNQFILNLRIIMPKSIYDTDSPLISQSRDVNKLQMKWPLGNVGNQKQWSAQLAFVIIGLWFKVWSLHTEIESWLTIGWLLGFVGCFTAKFMVSWCSCWVNKDTVCKTMCWLFTLVIPSLCFFFV